MRCLAKYGRCVHGDCGKYGCMYSEDENKKSLSRKIADKEMLIEEIYKIRDEALAKNRNGLTNRTVLLVVVEMFEKLLGFKNGKI